MTNRDAQAHIVNYFIAAYSKDEIDRKVINEACENIYRLGRIQGMNDAYEVILKGIRKEKTHGRDNKITG